MAWRKVLALGFVVSGVIAGCTVTTDDDTGTDGGDHGNDHDAGTGGKATGGGSSTGGKGTGGGSSTGGKGTGGSLPDRDAADVCSAETGDDECGTCAKTKCCQELTNCTNNDVCNGSGSTKGEFEKFMDCMGSTLQDAGALDTDAILTCAGEAAASGSVVDDTTDALITCLTDIGDAGGGSGCDQKCFGVDF